MIDHYVTSMSILYREGCFVLVLTSQWVDRDIKLRSGSVKHSDVYFLVYCVSF